jgi:RNA polymerase-binding transcription factor DksA
MSDDVDIAIELEEAHRDRALRQVREAARRIPAGEPGECVECGEYYARLVGGRCAGCRDEKSPQIRGL